MIEDSVPGVTGALAAGMTVLGFHGGSHCRPGYGDTLRAAGAAVTFDDMRQLPGLIGQTEIRSSFRDIAQRCRISDSLMRNGTSEGRCQDIAQK